MTATESVRSRPAHPNRAPLRVIVLIVAIALAGASATMAMAGRDPLPGGPFELEWYLLAPLFYLTERTVVHLRFHRHAHSFSLSEIPVVIGLHFASPASLIFGQVLGTALALTLHRRQRPVKLAFNTSQLALQTAIGIWVFRSILGQKPVLGLVDAAATLAAVGASMLVANLLVSLAIRLSGGKVSAAEMLRVFALGVVAAGMSGALALVAVHLMWLRPASAWIAVTPPAVLFVAYRAYVTQRQERARISAVYEVTRELHRSPQIEQALEVAATQARRVFDAEQALVYVLSAPGQALVTSVSANGSAAVMQAVGVEELHPLAAVAIERRAGVLAEEAGRRGGARAMAAPITDRDLPIGVLVVNEPIDEVASYGATDLAMLETLTSQVGVSLENGRLEDSLAELTRLKEDLHHQALHDGLTGLANRRLLLERLQATLDGLGESQVAALLFLDLDDFKAINDTHGHHCGDELLHLVAARLEEACRKQDLVARLGGDEFAILLARLPDPQQAEQVAQRILAALRPPFSVAGQAVFVSASLGIAYLEPSEDASEVLRRADQAMYEAKWEAKGSYQVYAASRAEGIRRRTTLRADIRQAITAGEIELHYQPVVELESGKVVGAEALVRWTHSELGRVPPLELLAAAEEAGAMGLLASWTVGRAASDLSRFQQTHPEMWVSFNASATQLDQDLVEAVTAALTANRVDPSTLVLEITETAASQSSEAVLDDLASLGLRIALDDFGTGYSSLARLDRLPIDILKIDRSFVSDQRIDSDASLVRIVLEIGDALGLLTIAEGVETELQRHQLLARGCRHAQGFLFATAVPAERLIGMIAENLLPQH